MIWQNFSTFRNVLLNYFKFPWIVLGLFVGGLAKLSRWPLKNWNNEIGETEEVNKSMVEGEILYSVSVFSTKYFFGRHLESLLQGMAQWKGCCYLSLARNHGKPPFCDEQYWAIAISVNMCWEANCLGLINYFANIYANYIFVCEITSKKQAIIFSGFALSYSLFTQNAILEKRHPESKENHW